MYKLTNTFVHIFLIFAIFYLSLIQHYTNCVQVFFTYYKYVVFVFILLYYTEIDKCAIDNGGCSPHATCIITERNVTCICNAGFTGDGKNCTGESIIMLRRYT